MSRAPADTEVAPPVVLRVGIPTDAELRRLIAEHLAPAVRGTTAVRCVLHDRYYDTRLRLLEQAGITCQLRTAEDGERTLIVAEHPPLLGIDGDPDLVHTSRLVAHGEAWRSEDNEPMRMLRGLVDPAELEPVLEVVTERYRRRAPAGLLRKPTVECDFDTVTVRVDGKVRTFREAALRYMTDDAAVGSEVLAYWGALFQRLPPEHSPLARARNVAERMHAEAQAARLGVSTRTVVIVAHDGLVACTTASGRLTLPTDSGCGASIAAALAGRFGGDLRDLTWVGQATPVADRDHAELWCAAASRRRGDSGIVWAPLAELLSRAGGPSVADGTTLAALALLAETPVVAELLARSISNASPAPDPPPDPLLLDAELSMIDFNARVLTMAEDASAAIGDRLRMLAITCANVDEFVMVRLAELRAKAGRTPRTDSPVELTASARLDAARARLSALEHRQAATFDACMAVLAEAGTRLRSWNDLSAIQQERLRGWFADTVVPRITTGGMTLILGHPFPRLPSLTLSLCVAGRSPVSGQWRLVQFDLPREVPRFVDVPGTADVIAVDLVARACADLVYPDLRIAAAYVFRVLREGDLDLTEQGDLFARVEEGTRRRGFNHIVRIEVEQRMPTPVRQALLATFQVEPGIADNALTTADLHVAPGPLALADVRELCGRVRAGAQSLAARPVTIQPLSTVWDEIAAGDRLYHHPYVAYDATVLRFFAAAAADPHVGAIWATLYRVGDPSPVVDALLAACAAGKRVSAYVELTARFDEIRNLSWVQRLEEGGVRVAYGQGDLKCHAKVALVERAEGGSVRRYAHVGTGNYNVVSARMYTDFSLLTADPRITADLRGFFDWLTDDTSATLEAAHCLIAPQGLLPGLLTRIEREIAHAGAGRPARIRLKVNALSEDELVHALYRASSAGVEVDLIVRGICTLRPGVPGVSDRIRVASRIGRFLEHGRIYHFGNGGADEYFIGSADWRPRNMRRRIEVVAPVFDPDARAQLGRILDIEAADPARWRLDGGGRYTRPAPTEEPSADERFSTSG